ncbi:grasp-with-spasm system SPASM domain peptide maturase [Flavobacterium sp.]|uniref:grasp-with-spasm system SPASM domain peptide maturase n=1 Tax=Flavobacterium sp. TaxID=239 RepID=UPI003D6B1B4D
MTTKKYFKVFANCIVTKGYNRGLILDIQRNNFTAIPDTMQEIISHLQDKSSINEVINLYGVENKDIINEYLDFLIENEFGFIVGADEFDSFINIDTSFEIASYVTNCIVEISKQTIANIDKIVNGLESLYCKDVQFVCYESLDLDILKYILKATNETNFRSIELILKYSEEVFEFIADIDKNNFRITELTLHSSANKNKEVSKGTFNIIFIDHELKDFRNCGIVDSKYFNNINKYKVFESLHHNSCLHKKISININGEIKNCPSMPESFGNIENTTLEEALNHLDFKKHWNITKDQIDVCKDCEFRHICTDCRAYVEEPGNQYSKPLKCGYSPYTNTWEEWSTNPLKQKAIAYYRMECEK